MKFIVLALGLGLSFSSFGALSFNCPGETKFNDSEPRLSEKTVVFFSKTSICGIDTDFATSCQTALLQQGNHYNFSWRCDEAFGDLYFTTENGGYAEYRCNGDAVREEYSNRVFTGCKLN